MRYVSIIFVCLCIAAGALVVHFNLPYIQQSIAVYKLVTSPADTELVIPIDNVRIRDIADTWGEARSEGRTHEGQDIFAERGTPVYSATRGYVAHMGQNRLGGTIVYVLGAGGVRYYYAHLDGFNTELNIFDEVSTTTILGYVGNTGNATGTPPHLHFGVYTNGGAVNPYPMLVDR